MSKLIVEQYPSIQTPIERNSLWRDEVLDITYRVLTLTDDGALVRCLSGESGKVWIDHMPRECFDTELELVN